MMTHAMLTGKTREHLVPLGEAHSLQPAALTAFTGLQQAAARDGSQLQPASTTSGIKNSTACARCWIKTARRWWQQRFPWRNAVPQYYAGLPCRAPAAITGALILISTIRYACLKELVCNLSRWNMRRTAISLN